MCLFFGSIFLFKKIKLYSYEKNYSKNREERKRDDELSDFIMIHRFKILFLLKKLQERNLKFQPFKLESLAVTKYSAIFEIDF